MGIHEIKTKDDKFVKVTNGVIVPSNYKKVTYTDNTKAGVRKKKVQNTIIKIDNMQQIALFPLIMGLLTAAVTGYLVINWLLAVISKGKFYLFSLYCVTIAIIAYIVIN